jgi:predicted NBD/HSP70 family sugar kinase
MEAFEGKQTTECILGVDLGATSLRVARVDANGNKFLIVPTPSPGKAEKAVRAIVGRARESMKVSNLGLSRAPAVDHRGLVSAWPSQKQWTGFPIIPWLQDSAGAPVSSADDGACATMWEHHARRNVTSNGITACIGIGTGLSVGIIGDDGLFPCGDGADTLSHGHFAGLDFPCKCGRRGCLQTVLRVQGLEQMKTAGRIDDVSRAFHEFTHNLRRRYNVDRVIITGGGVDRFGKKFLKEVLGKSAFDAGVNFEISLTPALSGIGGALLLAIDHTQEKTDLWAGRVRRFIQQARCDTQKPKPEFSVCAGA